MMNNREEFLPKWLPQTRKPQNMGNTLAKFVLVIVVYLFTLGFMSMFEHASNGMKGKH